MADVVLFGAGASYGSGEVVPELPPLGNELFTRLERLFPRTWGSLPEPFRLSFVSDFEKGMEEIWNSQSFSQNISQLIRNMAFYFNEFKIYQSSKNLYLHFVKDIKSNIHDIIFSTLNYDLLLELALSMNGISVDYFSDAPHTKAGLVWKLHGSPNFLLDGIQAMNAQNGSSSISFTSGVSFNSGLKAVMPQEAQNYCNSNTALYPAMSLYMKSKFNQIGHEVITNLQNRWQAKIMEAKNILIIGVKPNFSDTHIWDPLTKTKGRIGYIGNLDAFENWINNGRTKNITKFLGKRWSQCYESSVNFMNNTNNK
jgi:hypothetical protein